MGSFIMVGAAEGKQEASSASEFLSLSLSSRHLSFSKCFCIFYLGGAERSPCFSTKFAVFKTGGGVRVEMESFLLVWCIYLLDFF